MVLVLNGFLSAVMSSTKIRTTQLSASSMRDVGGLWRGMRVVERADGAPLRSVALDTTR